VSSLPHDVLGRSVMPRVVAIPLRISTAFLVQDDSCILIDTGCPREEDRIEAALLKEGVRLADLKLLLHTHAHFDHCGSTSELKKRASAPVAVHHRDAPLLRAGQTPALRPIHWAGTLLKPFVQNAVFPPVEPDIVFGEEVALHPFGVRGRILFTPGHTPGSLSVLLEDGAALVGDLMMGGYLGGRLLPSRPCYHYFADDLAELHASIKKLLDHGPTIIYPAHGGPLRPEDVRQRFSTLPRTAE